MHTKIIDSSINKPAFGPAEISSEFVRPNAKRIRHSEINRLISPETNMEHSRPKRLCSVKSSPVLGQIFQNKDKKNLFESLNIIEAEKKSRPVRSSPTKLSRNSSCSDLKNKKSLNQTSNRNSFTCLRNLGSTCYINCIIQVMRYTPGFVLSIGRLNKQIEFLKSLKNANIDSELNRNNDIAFVKNLHELLVDMSKIEQSDRRPIYTPRKFVNTVWTLLSFWSDGSQQDAHEFLQYTIHFINECDLSIRKLHQQFQLDQAVDEAKPRRVARKSTSKPVEKVNEKINLTSNNPLLLVTDESSSSSVSSTCSSSASSTSAVSAPIFRLRSAPNTTATISTSSTASTSSTIHSETNLLRTPTKGGASSFNIAVLDSNLSSSKDSDQELIFRAMIKSDPISKIKKTSPILTDSDLVSKRLKETLYSSSFKLDSSKTNFLNDSECIIITDSDDEVYFMDDNEEMPVMRPSKNLNESYELKKCYVLLERIKIDQLRVPSVEKTTSVDNTEIKPIKKAKRSRTVENTVLLMDLDAITTVSIGRNNSSSSSESFSLRKLRSNNSASCLKQNSVSTPPSPAELLRKYSVGSGYTCEMDKLFKGSSVTVTQCLECENLRKCPESFYDRSIPLETTENEDESSCWIAKCLSNESYLNENSKYMCDQCASKQEAKIETMYTHMPSILVLHLLSYGITSSDDGNLNTRKLSNRLRLVNYFDFECDKEDVCASKSNLVKHQFKLFAVVMHSGVSLNSGHYTAFVNYKIICQNFKNFDNSLNLIEQSKDISEKNCLDAEWLHFDDTKVKSLSNTEFQRKIIDSNYDSPYILFYVKDSI